jgi:hypothetical protein
MRRPVTDESQSRRCGLRVGGQRERSPGLSNAILHRSSDEIAEPVDCKTQFDSVSVEGTRIRPGSSGSDWGDSLNMATREMLLSRLSRKRAQKRRQIEVLIDAKARAIGRGVRR